MATLDKKIQDVVKDITGTAPDKVKALPAGEDEGPAAAAAVEAFPALVRPGDAPEEPPFDVMPLADRLIVLDDKLADEQRPSGLFVPSQQAQQLHGQWATVIAVGPGKYNEHTDSIVPVSVGPGAHVMYAKYAGAEFERNGKKYRLLGERDILCRD